MYGRTLFRNLSEGYGEFRLAKLVAGLIKLPVRFGKDPAGLVEAAEYASLTLQPGIHGSFQWKSVFGDPDGGLEHRGKPLSAEFAMQGFHPGHQAGHQNRSAARCLRTWNRERIFFVL
jgi:hypothetical protein